MAASLWDPFQRWFVGIFVIPLGLTWAVAFSYDLRNLALIIPWAGAAAGIGLMQIVSWAAELCRLRFGLPQSILARSASEGTCRPRWHFGLVSVANVRGIMIDERERVVDSGPCQRESVYPQGCLRVGHVVGLSMLLLITISLCISNEMLLNTQRRQQRMVGVPELNNRLYAFAADHPGGETIATDYQAMRWLPELGRRSVVCTCHEYSAFQQTFDRPEVRYVLVHMPGAAAEVRAFLAGQTAAQLLFESHGFAFYDKCHSVHWLANSP